MNTSRKTGEVLSVDNLVASSALGVLAVAGFDVPVDVALVLLELPLNSFVGVQQVVFDLVIEFFDDLVEFFDAGGRDDLGVVEEFLHEVVVVEFGAGCFFFLLGLFFSSLVFGWL